MGLPPSSFTLIQGMNSAPSLPAIPPLAARAALPGRLPHRDFFLDSGPALPDFLGYREDLGAKPLGVLDLDPRAVAQDDHAERWPHPVLLFDEEEIGSELEPVPVVHPLRGLPFLGNEDLALPARCGRDDRRASTARRRASRYRGRRSRPSRGPASRRERTAHQRGGPERPTTRARTSSSPSTGPPGREGGAPGRRGPGRGAPADSQGGPGVPLEGRRPGVESARPVELLLVSGPEARAPAPAARTRGTRPRRRFPRPRPRR